MAPRDLEPDGVQITLLLQQAGDGRPEAEGELLQLVYEDLRKQARRMMANVKAGNTLQATALIHEAWLKLNLDQPGVFENRAHFFGAAARAMRNILVDQARRKARAKHGGDRGREELHPEIAGEPAEARVDLIALDEALTSLEETHQRPARIVMLRYFAGQTLEAIAEMYGVSTRTIDREWSFARAWLQRRLVRP